MVLHGLLDFSWIRCVIRTVNCDQLVCNKVVASILQSEGITNSNPTFKVQRIIIQSCHNNVGLFSSGDWGASILINTGELVTNGLNVVTSFTVTSIEDETHLKRATFTLLHWWGSGITIWNTRGWNTFNVQLKQTGWFCCWIVTWSLTRCWCWQWSGKGSG